MVAKLIVTADNYHSRIVGWAKIILPLTAVGLLSTLFLFSNNSGDGTEIPFAKINELARDQRISKPQFSGVANDGSILEIAAESALPNEGNLDFLTIVSPRLDLVAADGTNLTIFAGLGIINGLKKQASLTGLARLETSSGFLMETEGLSADFGTGIIESDGPLEIHAPFGEIIAGKVTIKVENHNTGQEMHFTNGVRMVYTPTSSEEE